MMPQLTYLTPETRARLALSPEANMSAQESVARAVSAAEYDAWYLGFRDAIAHVQVQLAMDGESLRQSVDIAVDNHVDRMSKRVSTAADLDVMQSCYEQSVAGRKGS